MTARLNPPFNLDNYPKSYGSIEGWRLGDFLHLPEAEQERMYRHLEQFCLTHANQQPALAEYNGYAKIGSGWEWSVFAKDNSTVIKVPAGIFPEVNEPEYIANAHKTYQLLSAYYPSSMVANTEFKRLNNTNIIEQARFGGQDNTIIDFNEANQWLLEKLTIFFESTANLLNHERWLPDFWLNEDPNGFVLRNVMINQDADEFAIIDFTSYLDPARMYPALCEKHCTMHSHRVQEMLASCQKYLKIEIKRNNCL